MNSFEIGSLSFHGESGLKSSNFSCLLNDFRVAFSERGMLQWYWGPIKGKVFFSGQKNGIENFKIHTEFHSGWANLHFHSIINNVETLLIFCLLNLSRIK